MNKTLNTVLVSIVAGLLTELATLLAAPEQLITVTYSTALLIVLRVIVRVVADKLNPQPDNT